MVQVAPTVPQSSVNPPVSLLLVLQLYLHLPLCLGQGWPTGVPQTESWHLHCDSHLLAPIWDGGGNPGGHQLEIKFSRITPDSFLTC